MKEAELAAAAKMDSSALRTWLVTGASGGIGEAVVRRVAAAGDRVVLVARGERVVTAAASLGDHALAIQADIAEAASLVRSLARLRESIPAIDVLVNCAGVHSGGKVGKLPLDGWQRVISTNLTGVFNTVDACLKLMPDGASIVTVGSVVGRRGFPGDSAYGSAKAGLIGLTRVLAAELAPRRIRANLVAPGLVTTDMMAGLSQASREQLIARVPLGRFARPDEIAAVICWVADSTYMTGSVISVDGGMSAVIG